MKKPDQYFIKQAAKVAQSALCLKRKCGAVVVASNRIIGRGFNGPPQNDLKLRRCSKSINKYARYPTDKTCCVHAEQRAIVDALKKHSSKVKGSSLYYTSLDRKGKAQYAGEAYCTLCSKMMVDVGIKFFCLLKQNGIKTHDSKQYNEQSFMSNTKKEIIKDGQ